MSDSIRISRRAFASGLALLGLGRASALAQGFAGLGVDADGFAPVTPGRTFAFLIAVVNVKAFGWRLPFHVFPLQLIGLLGVALAAALCAALLPVIRLARMQPATLIRIFANER